MRTVYSRKRAFTLIELLVVVSIILIATSILFIGGGGGGDGIKLSSSQRIVSSIVQGARGQALLKGARARLIIYSERNTGDPDKLLRYFGVVYWQEDDPATPDDESGWVATSQGTYLPEGIYFDHITSSTIGDSTWPKAQATMNLEYPRQSPQQEGAGAGDEYYFYEFNSNGTVSSDFINTWMVLRAGTLQPGTGGTLEVDIEDPTQENLKTALIFRRVGSTTLVTNFGDDD